MKPVSVLALVSESPVLEREDPYTFHEFERLARMVALEHTTGGYLKTQVHVTFDEGTTFACRLDLSPKIVGFEDYVKTLYRNLLRTGGQQEYLRFLEAIRFDENHVLTQPNIPLRVQLAHGHYVEVEDVDGEFVNVTVWDAEGNEVASIEDHYQEETDQ